MPVSARTSAANHAPDRQFKLVLSLSGLESYSIMNVTLPHHPRQVGNDACAANLPTPMLAPTHP